MNTKPEVNAFATPESKVSPVPQIERGPPVGPLVAVCGVDRIVHRTVSPTFIVVMASVTMPPVWLVQSTNPMSLVPKVMQSAGVISPILTSKNPGGPGMVVVVVWPGIVVVVVVVVAIVVVVVVVTAMPVTFTCPCMIVG